MIDNKKIAVVVPAYNEENQIKWVIDTMPEFVDRIVVVNDCSKDKTSEVVKSLLNSKGSSELVKPKSKAEVHDIYNKANEVVKDILHSQELLYPKSEILHNGNQKLVLIDLLENSGVGGAIASGYKWARDHQIDCTAVMAGDGQMDPSELESICLPVIKEDVDYVKGDRLSHPSAKYFIPRTRFIGNSILSILTKVASGYWHLSDTQTGYTAISLKALEKIKLFKIYRRYGMPNDMLVKLNVESCTLRELEIKPVYHVGEQSKMKIHKVIPKVSWLLLKSFYKRLWVKYFLKSFHPLFILYHLGFLLLLSSIPYCLKIISRMISQVPANPLTALAFTFLVISGFQALLFAMWMDIQDNERLNK